MRINYNISSIIARNALNNNDTRLSESIQRLSSGLKINSKLLGQSKIKQKSKNQKTLNGTVARKTNYPSVKTHFHSQVPET